MDQEDRRGGAPAAPDQTHGPGRQESDAERAPFILRVALGLGALLGAWLAWEGLYARLFGSLPALSMHFELWAWFLRRWQVDPVLLAWPLVVVGTTWWGSLAGVWIRHRWGWPFAIALGLVSLFFLGPSTLIAAALLAILLLPAVRAWRGVT